MVEDRYRRSHVVGQSSRGGRRVHPTPYQRYPPPPPPGKVFYPAGNNFAVFQRMPSYAPNEMHRNVASCMPPFPLRPPPFLPPLQCMPRLPQYTQPPPIPAPQPPKKPQFHLQYEEFERMKRNGMVFTPEFSPVGSPHDLLDEPAANSVDKSSTDIITSAMKSFMQSYTPSGCFNPTKTSNDWSQEAVNLLQEISTSYNKQPNSMWNIPNARDNFEASPKCGDDYQLDVMRHIRDMKPSPYPGGSPISSKSRSNPCSDNDADDETTPAGSPVFSNQAVGAKRTRKKMPSPHSRESGVMDSGYQSSSTESGSVVGKMPKFYGMDSDIESGFTTGSSRPTSPVFPKSEPQIILPPNFPNVPNPPPMPFPAMMNMPPPPDSFVPNGGRSVSRDSEDADSAVYFKHKAWITDEILGMIAVRDRLYRRMKKHPAPDIVDMYKKIRNMVVGMTRNAKRAYEKKIEDQRIQRNCDNSRMYHASLQPPMIALPIGLPMQ